MKRFWMMTVIVLAMLMTALPASAKKPDNPGKPPPAESVVYEVTMDFVADAEGLSTTADPTCGIAEFITMEWDGRSLGATFDTAGLPMLDVNLGPGLLWYRNYPYIPSPADIPVGFDPTAYPYDPPLSGDSITGCHGAGIDVWIDFFAPGDHKYELNTGLFRLTLSDGGVDLLWHSDYYTPYERLNKKRWGAATIEDFTYSGELSWTDGGQPVVFDPVNGSTGLVAGDLQATHFSPGSYDPFPGSPRPVEFILTVEPIG